VGPTYLQGRPTIRRGGAVRRPAPNQDGSAGFDLPDALYLGHALSDANYLWYEEPMREFNITAYRRLAEQVRVPLPVAETSDGCHYNPADFIFFEGL